MRRGPIEYETFVEASFQQNGYVVRPVGEPACWIIDPGFPPQCDDICEYVREHSLAPAALVLTHAHADHIAGVDPVRENFPELPIWIHPDEEPLLRSAWLNLSAAFGMPVQSGHGGDAFLHHGDDIALGATTWRVLDVSGHSPGGIALYNRPAGIVIVGDALFAGSIGRHDFPHSDGRRLLRNIRESLLSLPDETVVLSGHGPETTIGRERKSNPYLVE
jgi:glyoxylase-like metal-dependent hydrolase (beta-lactamase superfamily II)